MYSKWTYLLWKIQFKSTTRRSLLKPSSFAKHRSPPFRTRFPVIKRISIRSTTVQAFTILRLLLVPQPAFCQAREWAIDRVEPGETVEINDRRITLNLTVLDRLNKAEHGQRVFKILSGGEVRDEKIIPIEVLARDEGAARVRWPRGGGGGVKRKAWNYGVVCPLLSVDEAAARPGCAPMDVWRLIHAGECPGLIHRAGTTSKPGGWMTCWRC